MLARGHLAKRPELQGMQPAAPMPAFDEIPSGPVSHHFTHSVQVGSDAMVLDAAAAVEHPAERPPLWHTYAQVAGGPCMSEFAQAMKTDAAAQEHIIELLGTLLDKTVQRNDGLGRKSDLPEFEAGKACPLTASAYLKRIMKYGCCSPCCVVVGLMYLQRLKQRNPTVCLTSGNMQRLLLTSVMVAAKFLDDLYYSNKHWARIGGLNLQEVNTLELKLLFQLSFSLCINREEYQEYLQGLIGAANITAPAAPAPAAMDVVSMAPSHEPPRGSIAAWQGGDTPMGM